MNMKNTMVFAFAIFALLAGTLFASVNPKVQLDSYTLSETPASPGSVVALKLNLKSIEWDNCAERVAVQLVVSYPLSIQGPDTQYLGTLCVNDSGTPNATVTFLLPVDSLAQTGTYPVSVATTYEKRFSKFSESNTVNLRVGGAPSFVASITSANPVDIYPGDSSAVIITFQNTGSSRVETSRVTLTSGSDDVSVKWAGATQQLGSIPARGSASATFNIESLKSASPGTYPLRAVVEYKAENNMSGSQAFSFDIPLKSKADFTAVAKTDGPLLAGEDHEVSIQLSNTGTDSAKKLKVRIKPTYPFSTDGTVRYVESLAPGEKANLTYVIHVDKDATSGEQVTGFLIDFEDKDGKKLSDSDDFSLSVRTKTLEESIMEYKYVAAIAGVLIAIFAIRKIAGMLFKKKE